MLIRIISGIHPVTWSVRGKRPDADADTAAALAAAQKRMEPAWENGGRVKRAMRETQVIQLKEPSNTCLKREHEGKKKQKNKKKLNVTS